MATDLKPAEAEIDAEGKAGTDKNGGSLKLSVTQPPGKNGVAEVVARLKAKEKSLDALVERSGGGAIAGVESEADVSLQRQVEGGGDKEQRDETEKRATELEEKKTVAPERPVSEASLGPPENTELSGRQAGGSAAQRAATEQTEQAAFQEEIPEDVQTPAVVSAKQKTEAAVTEKEIQAVADKVNTALDAQLMRGVARVWGAALPTFGGSILLGAILGDLLLLLKGFLIRQLLKPLLHGEKIKKYGNQVIRKVKIKGKIKLNIAAMNGLVLLIPALFIVLVFVSICNHPVYKVATFISGQAEMCKYFDASNLGTAIGQKIVTTTTGTFQCRGQYCTNQWDAKIAEYSSKYAVDACIVKTVVEKESHGNASAIGHDNHNSAGDQFSLASPPLYNLNWSYSHGIGITQWTIFPNTRAGFSWIDQNTPSRNLPSLDTHPSQWYMVSDFLNPDISLALTARKFAVSLAGNSNNLQKAFGDYNGSGEGGSYAQDAMRLYQICKLGAP